MAGSAGMMAGSRRSERRVLLSQLSQLSPSHLAWPSCAAPGARGAAPVVGARTSRAGAPGAPSERWPPAAEPSFPGNAAAWARSRARAHPPAGRRRRRAARTRRPAGSRRCPSRRMAGAVSDPLSVTALHGFNRLCWLHHHLASGLPLHWPRTAYAAPPGRPLSLSRPSAFGSADEAAQAIAPLQS